MELSLAFFFFEGGAATAAEVARSAAALAFCSSAKEPVGEAALPSCAASIVGRDGRCFRSSRHAQQQKRQAGEFFEISGEESRELGGWQTGSNIAIGWQRWPASGGRRQQPNWSTVEPAAADVVRMPAAAVFGELVVWWGVLLCG